MIHLTGCLWDDRRWPNRALSTKKPPNLSQTHGVDGRGCRQYNYVESTGSSSEINRWTRKTRTSHPCWEVTSYYLMYILLEEPQQLWTLCFQGYHAHCLRWSFSWQHLKHWRLSVQFLLTTHSKAVSEMMLLWARLKKKRLIQKLQEADPWLSNRSYN